MGAHQPRAQLNLADCLKFFTEEERPRGQSVVLQQLPDAPLCIQEDGYLEAPSKSDYWAETFQTGLWTSKKRCYTRRLPTRVAGYEQIRDGVRGEERAPDIRSIRRL